MKYWTLSIMELSDLTIFKQVVESGGITRAAEKLNRVPSNVTARVKKLEDELGTSLFLREKNRLKISASGKRLLEYAHQILDLAQEAIAELQQNKPTGVLTVGAMEAVAATRLVEPVVRFHQAFPDIELNIKTAPTGDLIDRVLMGEVDMAFVADPPSDNRLCILPIYQETLILVSDLHHKIIKKPTDLQLEPTLLGFSHSCAYRTRLTDWLKQGNIIAKIVEINSYHTLLSCVAAGMGVGVVPQALLEHYPFSQKIQTHPLPAKWKKSVTAIIWRNDSITSSMEAFTQCVTN